MFRDTAAAVNGRPTPEFFPTPPDPVRVALADANALLDRIRREDRERAARLVAEHVLADALRSPDDKFDLMAGLGRLVRDLRAKLGETAVLAALAAADCPVVA